MEPGQKIKVVNPKHAEDYGKTGTLEFMRDASVEAFFDCDADCCNCAVSYDDDPNESGEVHLYTYNTEQLEAVALN